MGRVLMGQGPSCLGCPHPTPLWSQGPVRPTAARSQKESRRDSIDVVSGAELPTSTNLNREDLRGQEQGYPHSQQPNVIH